MCRLLAVYREILVAQGDTTTDTGWHPYGLRYEMMRGMLRSLAFPGEALAPVRGGENAAFSTNLTFAASNPQGCDALDVQTEGYRITTLLSIVKGFASLHLLRNIEWSDEKRLGLTRFLQKTCAKQVTVNYDALTWAPL